MVSDRSYPQCDWAFSSSLCSVLITNGGRAGLRSGNLALSVKVLLNMLHLSTDEVYTTPFLIKGGIPV